MSKACGTSTKKFADKYKKFFGPNQLHTFLEIANNPTVQAALCRNRLPAQKTVYELLESNGIDVNAVLNAEDDDDYYDSKSCKKLRSSYSNDCDVTASSGGGGGGGGGVTERTVKDVLNSVLRIESKLDALEGTLNKNLEFAMPSDSVQTDLTFSSEKRQALVRKQKNNHRLMYTFDEIYPDFVKEHYSQSADDYEMLKNLFHRCFFLIDHYVNDDFFEKFARSGSARVVVNPQITVIVFDRDDRFGNTTEPLICSSTMQRVLKCQEESKLFSVKKDPIIFVSMSTDVAEQTGSKRVFRIVFYIDAKSVFADYERLDVGGQDVTLQDSININPVSTSKIWENCKFGDYFMELCKDAYVHLYCALCSLNPCIRHDGIFLETYTSLFCSRR